jgi:hypothetical protein
MNSYKLLQSIQAGPFSTVTGNKMIDFQISEGLVIDPSQCFVQLRVHLNTAETEVHNMLIRNTTDGLTPFNVDLIRNCSLTGDKVGRLEDVRRVNFLQHNLLELSKSTVEKASMIDGLYQPRENAFGMLISPLVELHKDGVIPSAYVDARLAIPLSHLFSIGSLTSLDTSKTGTLRIHLELENLNYLEVVESTLFKKPVLAFEGKMVDITTPSNTITTVTDMLYDSLEQSPYFVGQHLLLSYTSNATSPPPVPVVNRDVTITGISYDSTTRQITLTLDYSFPALPATATFYDVISVVEKTTAAAFELSIVTAELGIAQLVGMSDSSTMLEYLTFTTEEYSNGTATLNKVFDIEPNAVNAMLFFGGSGSNMISNNDFVSSYRMRVDNLDVYDRDIAVNIVDGGVLMPSSLHYDAINRTFLNAGLPLKSLKLAGCRFTKADAKENDISVSNRYTDVTNNITILATPTPVTAGTKKLQFNVDTTGIGAVIQNVVLYKQIVRQVKL